MKNRSKISKRGFNFNVHDYRAVQFHVGDDILVVRLCDMDIMSLKRLVKVVTKSHKKWKGTIAYRERYVMKFIDLSNVTQIEFK